MNTAYDRARVGVGCLVEDHNATTSFSFIAWRYQHRALFASTRFATQSTSPFHNVIHPPHVMSVTRCSNLFLIFNYISTGHVT